MESCVWIDPSYKDADPRTSRKIGYIAFRDINPEITNY